METIKLELTIDEFRILQNVLKKIEYVRNPPEAAPKKWQRAGNYLINTKTGRRMNVFTKKFDDSGNAF